ncbi:MAG TPA: response regulator transcription factor [Flavipsychrobacter sp.]|nr:response regulator transcription factor [Flavipsychrobacter sp.]
MAIKVAITDDHPLAISGLQNMLSGDKHIEVIATYENGTALLTGLEKMLPDVLLLDIELPDYKGYDLAQVINKEYPSVKMLAITSHDAPILVKRMMQHGCSGYVLKNTRVKELIFAIKSVYAGEEYIEPSLKEQMMQHTKFKIQTPTFKIPILTQREKAILKLIVQEHTNQEIANELFISLRTVENHRFSLLQKLDVKNSIGLVRVAIQLGMLED